MSGGVAAIEVKAAREGAIFRVKVRPGASATAVTGDHQGALKVSVRAPPEKGKANEALVRFLARALGLDRSSLEIVSGGAARQKALLARGADPAALEARLGELAAGSGSGGGGRRGGKGKG